MSHSQLFFYTGNHASSSVCPPHRLCTCHAVHLLKTCQTFFLAQVLPLCMKHCLPPLHTCWEINGSKPTQKMANRGNSLGHIYKRGKALSGAFWEETVELYKWNIKDLTVTVWGVNKIFCYYLLVISIDHQTGTSFYFLLFYFCKYSQVSFKPKTANISWFQHWCTTMFQHW